MSDKDETTIDLEDEIKDEEETFELIDPDDETVEKDWKAEALKLQAILTRKQKQAAKTPKVEVPKPESDKTDNKNNQSEYLTRDEGILIAQGTSEEALKQ